MRSMVEGSAAMTLEEAYLDHILLHMRSRDPDDRPLRTYLDSWYAHHVGSAMMERRIPRPQWVNTDDLEKRPELAMLCHAISLEADDQIVRGETSLLVRDHVIPIAQLTAELKSRDWRDREELRTFLLERYRVAVVTKAEHSRLGKGDSARRKGRNMAPSNGGPYLRYDCREYGVPYRLLKEDL
jgi:hypothetical protein